MNWNHALFPSLHHRKEGWLRHQENFAQPPKRTQPGWFSSWIQRKTTLIVLNVKRSVIYITAAGPVVTVDKPSAFFARLIQATVGIRAFFSGFP